MRRGRPIGFHHSEETRRKMSEARKRVLADPEVRARISEGIRKRCELRRAARDRPLGVTPEQAAADRALLERVKRELGL